MSKKLKSYYDEFFKKYNPKIEKELFFTRYKIFNDDKRIDYKRIIIEKGIEISILESKKNSKLIFDKIDKQNDFFEIGFCLKGKMEMNSSVKKHNFKLEKNQVYAYKQDPKVERVECNFFICKMFSISIDWDLFLPQELLLDNKMANFDWKEKINKIFKKKNIINFTPKFKINEVAKKIFDKELNTIMDFMEFKILVIEFISDFINDQINLENKVLTYEEKEIFYSALELIRSEGYNISNNEIAKKLYLSNYKLQKIFKEMCQCTVHQYKIFLKIEHSKVLLRETNENIISIAYTIGYDNPSKFSNIFKNYENMTPSEYRKIIK